MRSHLYLAYHLFSNSDQNQILKSTISRLLKHSPRLQAPEAQRFPETRASFYTSRQLLGFATYL